MSKIPSINLAPLTIDQLLKARDWTSEQRRGEILPFRTTEQHDVYNITAPFEHDGETVIAGRTEERSDEVRTVTRFFKEAENGWVQDTSLPTLPLQDPFVAKIHGAWIFGGVKVEPVEHSPSEVATWETHIYSGANLRSITPLLKGPPKMKDIRLVELRDGIGVFTRPQGIKGGRGKIGFTMVKNLEAITGKLLEDAPIIPNVFVDEEWGGVNEAHQLEDGRIGAIGHIARYGADGREYFPMTFIFNPITFTFSQQKIIAERSCFPETDAKKPDIQKVLFSGGITILGKTVTWYGGISDTSAGRIADIPDPFELAA